MIDIDLRSRVPIYEQIKNQIMELVLLGVLKPDDKLPSIRALSKDLTLNVNTVKKAFSDLENAGVIYTLSGRGSYIANEALENNNLRKKHLDEVKISLKTARVNGITKDEIIKVVEETYNGGKNYD